MNYDKSNEILEKINSAKNILVNCHRSPDPDSIGSALSFKGVLKSLNKNVTVVCPTKLDDRADFLPGFSDIKIIDFSTFNFSKYDLFIFLDSSDWSMVTGRRDLAVSDISTIMIDHHSTNKKFADINLVDIEANSTAIILFKIYQDWETVINKEISECLLTAILGDTVNLKYGVTPETLDVIKELIIAGADKKEITYHLFDSLNFELVKFWGDVIREMQLDANNKFVWAAIPNEKFKEHGSPENGKESAATEFFESIKDTDFGILMVEKEKGTLTISFRSRSSVDVSRLALEFGGGGHPAASGASVHDMPFEKARDHVLEVTRKFVQKK